jgi:hypothetical protein
MNSPFRTPLISSFVSKTGANRDVPFPALLSHLSSPSASSLTGLLQYFALRYDGDLEAALIANANCGGDSAVRGMVVGMLLGAAPGNERPCQPRTAGWWGSTCCPRCRR